MPKKPERPQLDPKELARYQRHLTLPDIGKDGQRRLKDARVLIIGLGGLGSPAALYLAAAGVGTLGLAEFDKVEMTNLQRQILYDTQQSGHPKLDAAQDRLNALNPDVTLKCHPEGINASNARKLCEPYDLILDGSDNFPTRYLVNDAAWFTHKPLVYGSIFQFEGQVTFFDFTTNEARTERSPCYRCLFPKMPTPGTIPNCAEAGVLGALCGIVGSLQAMEAIKYFTGAGELLCGRLLAVEALAPRFRILNVKHDPNCTLCGTHPNIHSIEPETYIWKGCVPKTTNEGVLDTEESALPI